jgi:uncharacterized damage-inducible protein DinB
VDRDTLRELFDYTTFTWASYGRTVRALPEGALLQPVERSGWPALRNALFHIAGGWDGWIHEQSGKTLPDIEVTDMTDWARLDAMRQTNRTMLEAIIDRSSEESLAEPVLGYFNGPSELTRAEIITHILLHERGHHGDVSTLLSALGAEPPGIDYMTYVFFRNRKK